MTDFAAWARDATDPAAAAGKPAALSGVRVLEFTPGNFGGMVAASILGEFGADVVKLEPPGGDPAREYAPEGIRRAGTGLPFLSEARNRRFVTLSIERAQGRDLFRRLALASDIVVCTEGPARMEDAGIGYRSLSKDHPGLVWLSLSLYGAFGPHADRPVKDADILCQALSGAPHIVGEPEEGGGPPERFQAPTRLGNWHGWFAAGLWGAFGVLAALRFRASSRRGQFVDISGAEGLMKFCDYNVTWMHTAGKARGRSGNFDPAVFPYTYIRTKDGYTFMAAYNDEAFATLMEIIGRPQLSRDPRFATPAARVRMENERALLEILEEWSAHRTADEILREVEAHTSRKSGPGAAVVTGRVNRPTETLAEANWAERGCFTRVDVPVYGNLLLPSPPWKMSGTPARIGSLCRPPGADNADVYGGMIGLSPETIRDLEADGVL